MDGERLREAVETAKATQLRRLDSGKLLIALTDADLGRERVLATAAASAHATAETFYEWAAAESNDAAREAFEEGAERADARYDRVIAHLDRSEPPETSNSMHAYLRGLDETAARAAAGLIGRSLVDARMHTQVVSFFINEGDRALTDLFRDLKAEIQDELIVGVDLLDRVCAEDDWAHAQSAAERTIQEAYDDYADSLARMGLDPKPIC